MARKPLKLQLEECIVEREALREAHRALLAQLAALQHDSSVSVYQQDPDHPNRFKALRILNVIESGAGLRVNLSPARLPRPVDPSKAELQDRIAELEAENIALRGIISNLQGERP